MNHSYIGTEHLLLGLLREPTSVSRTLVGLGMNLEAVREQIATGGASSKPAPLTPEEATAEREKLRSLIDALPEELLQRARHTLEHLQRFPRPDMIAKMRERMAGRIGFGGGGGWLGVETGATQEGHYSSRRVENGTMICETRRIHKGHEVKLLEKLRVSDDGKTLNYTQELRGPKGEHHWSMDFDYYVDSRLPW